MIINKNKPTNLIISLFPGLGLLDKAFQKAGYIVVKGPDILWGEDIRHFNLPPGLFWGVIGGPPCQDFSSARRAAPTGYGLEMLAQYSRLVLQAQPEWWLMENVSRVPDWQIPGYCWQRLDVDNAWFPGATSRRLRHIQFGSRSGRLLDIPRGQVPPHLPGAAMACDDRSLEEVKMLQGLPENFNPNGYTRTGLKKAIGNGVPLPTGYALASEITRIYSQPAPHWQPDLWGELQPVGRCACPCRRSITGNQQYYDASCRKRAQRRRDASNGHSDTPAVVISPLKGGEM